MEGPIVGVRPARMAEWDERHAEYCLAMWFRRLAVTLACFAYFACSSSHVPLHAPPPVTPPSTEHDEPDAQAPDANVDAAIALAEGSPVAPDAAVDAGPNRSPREQLIRGVVAGVTPLAEAIDPEYGVVTIRYLSPPRNLAGRPGVPATSSSRRHCGRAVARALPSLGRDLADVLRLIDAGLPFQCGDDGCVVRGEGPAPTWYLRFSERDLSVRLELVAQVSESGMDEAGVARVRAYIDRGQAAGGTRPCTMACLSRAHDVRSGIDCVVNLHGGLEPAVRAYGYLGLAELVTVHPGDVTRTMETYVRRFPSSPLAAAWRSYLNNP